jgi:hypothetical protein
MKNYKILTVALLSFIVVVGVGYLFCDTDQCLSQPSITEVTTTRILCSVYHQTSPGSCTCIHDTTQTTGDIIAEVYNASDQLLITLNLVYQITAGCNEYWEKRSDYSGGAKYVIFKHVGYSNCTTRVDL